MRRLRLPLLNAIVLALTACSILKVAYSNVDLYLRWKADDYFALDSQQRGLVKAQLDATTTWHRSEELPRYTDLLHAAQDRVARGLDSEDMEWFYQSVRMRYEALARQSAPGAAEVLSTLTPAQIAHFEAKLERENERFAVEFVERPPDLQRRERFKRSLNLMEEWVGPLSEAQRARMEGLSFQIPLTNGYRLEDRQRRQRALLAILKRHRPADALAPRLEAWLIEWDKGRSTEYQRSAEEARRQTVAMLVELDRMLEREQRVHLESKLARYAAEFQSLAGDGSPRASVMTLPEGWLLAYAH